MLKQLLRPLASSRDGSVILETALMITILLMLMFGIVDLGRALFTENLLVSAVREGARTGAVQSTIDTAAVKTIVIDRFRFTPLGGAALTTSNIATTLLPPGGPYTSMRVSAAYHFTWITPIRSLVGAMRDSLHAQAEYRLEQQ